ncbi:hypothetical protein HDV00_007088 [Rhizophlyctis rosea]|nr:hypothetical protein HDV00_007088 [Rhizophlyctis rosea]
MPGTPTPKCRSAQIRACTDIGFWRMLQEGAEDGCEVVDESLKRKFDEDESAKKRQRLDERPQIQQHLAAYRRAKENAKKAKA